MVECRRIFLLEDNAMDARVIQSHLKKMFPQAQLTHVETLGEAEAMASVDGDFDVVITDLNVPDSTGFATFHKIRGAFPMVPVFVLSGFTDYAIALECVRSGAQEFISKSELSAELLQNKINFGLARHVRFKPDTGKNSGEKDFFRESAPIFFANIESPLTAVKKKLAQLVELSVSESIDNGMLSKDLWHLISKIEQVETLLKDFNDKLKV